MRDSTVRRYLPRSEDEPDFSLLTLVNGVLRIRRLIVGLVFAGAVVGACAAIHSSPSFTAESTFLVDGRDRQVSGATGLAAQFGLDTRFSDQLDFYRRLLSSRELLKEVVTAEFWWLEDPVNSPDTVRGDLFDLFELHDIEDEAIRMRVAINRLRDSIEPTLDRAAGVVILQTTAPRPELAIQINQRLLDLVNDFNLQRRQTRAAMERAFTEERTEEARVALREAERRLETFLDQNRRLDSPYLQFEASRLERDVEFRQRMYTGLAQQYEAARAEEIRDMPVITVVDSPEGSILVKGRGLKIKTAAGGMAGAGVALLFGLFRSHVARRREENAPDYGEFVELTRDVRFELRSLKALGRPRQESEVSGGAG